ncbi:MAG TPA: winged helix-turn-helix domain-containing protein [Bacillales bacterium]|nr:winged helix-turn-helix domain-containing protein [Bacillales bacterium]
MKINDMDLAKTAFDPKLVRIINQVETTPKTVKEIAEALNEKPSRLYYHINKLVDQGLLEVKETKQVGNLLEKTYAVVQDLGDFDFDEEFAKENVDYVIQQFLMTLNKSITAMKQDIQQKVAKENLHSQASILQVELAHEDWLALCAEIRRFINERSREAEKQNKTDKKPITYVLMSHMEED